jgi:hypothetical protein
MSTKTVRDLVDRFEKLWREWAVVRWIGRLRLLVRAVVRSLGQVGEDHLLVSKLSRRQAWLSRLLTGSRSDE